MGDGVCPEGKLEADFVGESVGMGLGALVAEAGVVSDGLADCIGECVGTILGALVAEVGVVSEGLADCVGESVEMILGPLVAEAGVVSDGLVGRLLDVGLIVSVPEDSVWIVDAVVGLLVGYIDELLYIMSVV